MQHLAQFWRSSDSIANVFRTDGDIQNWTTLRLMAVSNVRDNSPVNHEVRNADSGSPKSIFQKTIFEP